MGEVKVGWSKDFVHWRVGPVLYLSVVFSWDLPDALRLAADHGGPVIIGGPAADLAGPFDWAEAWRACPYNVLAMHNPLATFTTRGCPRSCKYCAVPKLEGEFREIPDFTPAPVICDNNLLAASRSHFEKVIDTVRWFPSVDFNQGLDARLFTRWHADLMGRLPGVMLRFALDHTNHIGKVHRAIQIAHEEGFTARDAIRVYILIGFDDTPEDALHRLELVCSWGHWPVPMRYQPLDAMNKNDYVAPGWTDEELKRMMRYYSRLRYFRHIPYGEFEGGESGQRELFEVTP